jgi:hypothetical protein
VSPGFTTCFHVATCTWPTVRHVYGHCTRGKMQVAKNNFFVVSLHLSITQFSEPSREFLRDMSQELGVIIYKTL